MSTIGYRSKGLFHICHWSNIFACCYYNKNVEEVEDRHGKSGIILEHSYFEIIDSLVELSEVLVKV